MNISIMKRKLGSFTSKRSPVQMYHKELRTDALNLFLSWIGFPILLLNN